MLQKICTAWNRTPDIRMININPMTSKYAAPILTYPLTDSAVQWIPDIINVSRTPSDVSHNRTFLGFLTGSWELNWQSGEK